MGLNRRDLIAQLGAAAAIAATASADAGVSQLNTSDAADGAAGDRLQWWRDARLGMFVRWGAHAVLAHGARAMLDEHIPPNEYARAVQRFAPREFGPADWIRVARDAGMKYIGLSARQADGFCLWDSRASRFTSTRCAAKRDFIAETARACRRFGMRLGLSYSLTDWRLGAPPSGSGAPRPSSAAAMIDQARAQLHELMSGYGTIDVLWYEDPPFADGRLLADLSAMVRRLQPGIAINDGGGAPGDFATSRQSLASHDGPWEAWMTMNGTPGYDPSDRNYRTPAQMLHQLLTCVSRKGNLLLEVSPDGHGRIPAEQLDRLCGLGRWIRANEQVVYRGRRAEINVPGLGWSLEAQGRTYIIPHRWYGETLTFGWCGRAVKSAKVLATGTPARVEQRGDRVWLRGLPPNAPDPYATVIEIAVA